MTVKPSYEHCARVLFAEGVEQLQTPPLLFAEARHGDATWGNATVTLHCTIPYLYCTTLYYTLLYYTLLYCTIPYYILYHLWGGSG